MQTPGRPGRLEHGAWKFCLEIFCRRSWVSQAHRPKIHSGTGEGRKGLVLAAGRPPLSLLRRLASSHRMQLAWRKASLRCGVRKLPEKKLAETTNTGRPEQQLDQQEHQADPKMAVWQAGFLELLHRLSTKLSSTTAGIRSRNRHCQSECQPGERLCSLQML